MTSGGHLWERTGESHEKQYWGQTRHKQFAERLNKTADNNPNVPELRHGRLKYIQDQLEKRGVTVSMESVRKWFSGESMPHHSRAGLLAEILRVDESWLIFGSGENTSPNQRRVRNALVEGAVNFVAGLVQMDGATVAFPEDDDRYAMAQHVNLHAIIRGASYAIHVVVATQDSDDRTIFSVPTDLRNTVPIGVVRHEGFNFSLYEITDMALELGRPGRTGKVEVDLHGEGVREIENFKERF
jgi:transcriptional regulator with XRE-family HTH domain